MKLVLSNTLARHKQEFVPLVPGRASLYTCGPTVHDYAHVGNFRTFTVYDVLRRTLRRAGYAVEQLMNLTDVEDRIIAKAGKAGVSIQEYTAPYIAAFHQHRRALRIEDAERYPLATEHVPEMVALIAELERKGHTYRADGSVYFRISSFPGYGKLSQKDLAGQRTGVRVDADDYDKEEALDFVLWKAAKPGEPSWDTPFGPGRPGWHIECSAMAMRYLGPSFDIHTGGVDLIFPHHENEIAQSEGATGLPFARIWLHAAFLNVQGDKMSKRKGNFFTVQDLLEDGVDPRALRYAYLGTHYRKPMNYSDETIAHAGAALARIDNTMARLDSETRAAAAPGALAAAIARAAAGFDAAIGDDLNTPEALAAIHGLLTEINTAIDRGEVGPADAAAARAAIADFDRVLAVLPAGSPGSGSGSGADSTSAQAAPAELLAIIAERELARARRDFAGSDRLRARALELGYVLEDVKGGATRWKKA